MKYKNKKMQWNYDPENCWEKKIIIQIKFVSDSRLYKIIFLMNLSVFNCPIIEMYVSE